MISEGSFKFLQSHFGVLDKTIKDLGNELDMGCHRFSYSAFMIQSEALAKWRSSYLSCKPNLFAFNTQKLHSL